MRIFQILSVVLLSVHIASAQSPDKLIEEIRAAAEGACVTVEYSLEAKVDDARIKDEGVVVAQDDLWILDGQTVDIYTSKDVTLIMNSAAKEAMVEPKWSYDDLKAFCRTIVTSSGNDVDLEIKSRTISAKKPVSYFELELGSDWVVTDLR